jgi:hypothetical protein
VAQDERLALLYVVAGQEVGWCRGFMPRSTKQSLMRTAILRISDLTTFAALFSIL